MIIIHISLIWAGPEKSVERLSPIFNLAEDWLSLGPSLYVVFTSEDMVTWQQRLRAVMGEHDSFLISQISNPNDTAGWMPAQFWTWLRQERASQPQIQAYLHSLALNAPPKKY